MNFELFTQYHNLFQIADLDDDMIGINKAVVDFLKIIQQLENFTLREIQEPDNFFKLQPHQPRMENRKNLRKLLAFAVQQLDVEDSVKLNNLYITLIAATYVYHLPTQAIIQASTETTEFTREASLKMLLDDDMSPNWIKEPSGKDFSALML